MKIEIEIPDWVEDEKQVLYLFAGKELIGRRTVGLPWQTKTARCNNCGLCCQNLSPDWIMGVTEEGLCVHLKQKGDKFVCDMGMYRPLSCSRGEPNKGVKKIYRWCSSRFKEMD